MAGTDFDKVPVTLLSAVAWLPTAASEKADRKSLRRLPLDTTYWQCKKTIGLSTATERFGRIVDVALQTCRLVRHPFKVLAKYGC
jgi:hypothetical protein